MSTPTSPGGAHSSGDSRRLHATLALLVVSIAVLLLDLSLKHPGFSNGIRKSASSLMLTKALAGRSTPRSAADREGAGGHEWRTCRIPPGIKLAIYNPRKYHSEVFGVLIAYARACGHSITTFFDGGDSTSALPYYDWMYGPVEKAYISDFTKERQADLDAVFFATPEILSGVGEDGHKSNTHRFIYYIHLLTHPAYYKEYMKLRLHMSPLVAGPPWALPVYFPPQLIGEGEKGGVFLSEAAWAWATSGGKTQLPKFNRGEAEPLSLPPSNSRLLSAKRLVMIGSMYDGENYVSGDIMAIAAGLEPLGWTVIIYSREWKSKGGTPIPKNVVVKEMAATDFIIEAVQTATFMLIYPAPKSWYVTDRMTGGLPLAISQATPILTTPDFASIYGMGVNTGVLAAPNPTDAVAALSAVTEASYTALLHAMAVLRMRAWAHAVHTIEDLLLGVPSIQARVQNQPPGDWIHDQPAGADGKAAAPSATPSAGAVPPPWVPLTQPTFYPVWGKQVICSAQPQPEV